MNYIMGANHLKTRMMVETRYKYGYTNDASGFLEDQWYGPGGYTFRSYSRPEVIENIYQNMMGELIRIRSEEVTEQEMFVAKGALADGSFPVRYLDGYALTRNFALERLRYGNHDRSATYVQRIRAVSKDDILNTARKYLRPDNMQIIVIGEEAFELE
jgi:predicted Zn-dependent peptidase